MKSVSPHAMHKVVFAFLGIFVLLVITYPISMIRVSQSDKFHGSHVKSLTLEYKAQ